MEDVAPLILDGAGQPLETRSRLARGGEGAIWRLADGDRVVKVYHEPDRVRVDKLEAMLAARPLDPGRGLDRPAIAWPDEAVFDANRRVIGFSMREAVGALPLHTVYLPALRRAHHIETNWHYMHAAACNVAVVLNSLHRGGYVVGDLKPQNFVIDATANVTILDTDSFQIPKPGGGVFRCCVGSEGFTPPELLGQELSAVDQRPEDDHFRLAVLVYLLLFGRHPFQGIWNGDGDPPSIDELVKQGVWCHGLDGRLQAPPGIPGLEVVSPVIADCLRRGLALRGERPDALEWAQALRDGLNQLVRCAGGKHFQRPGLPCPWCKLEQDSGLDVFNGSMQVPQSPAAVLTAVVPQASPTKLQSAWRSSAVVFNPGLCEWVRDEHRVRLKPTYWFVKVVVFVSVLAFTCTPAYSFLSVLGFTLAVAVLAGCVKVMLAAVDFFLRLAGISTMTNLRLLPGVMTSCEPKVGVGRDRFLVVDYTFVSPEGRVCSGRTAIVDQRGLKAQAPRVGSQVVVAYAANGDHNLL